MKNLLKFTAVVAACTLVSCSNDFDELGSIDQPTAANELKIVAEEMGGGSLTRSAYVSESSNDRVWQETDKFQVFGAEIVGKYDYYKFKKSSNKFELDGTKDLTDASYVAFPAENVESQKWVKEDGAGSITFKIPNKLSYDEVSGTSPVAYVSNLPLWGTAENDGEGIKANVYFLTSIIKVYLTNALNNAQAVRIRAFNDIEGEDKAMISGISTVQVSENNVALSASEVQLANPTAGNDDDAKLSNTITVDLGDLKGKATNSVIYIPLIAGYYGQVVIEYLPSDKNAETATDDDWEEIRTYLDKDFKRGTPYGKDNVQVFEANVNSISGLNKILANISASGEVAIASQTAITEFDNNGVLTVPDLKNVTKLTLNTKFTDTDPLTVVGDFAGTLVLNPAAGTAAGNLDIRTKNANVVMGGTWTTGKSLTFTYAKNVQFGGLVNEETEEEIPVNYGTTAPGTNNAITLGAAVEGVIVAEKATVGAITLDTNHKAATLNVLGIAGDITVKASTLQKATAVKVAGTAGAIKINDEKNEATVELTGKAASITNEGKGAITISGNPEYGTAGKKVATVTTSGDVTINLANEGVAIGTKLTFNAPAALTLTQGYVKEIEVNIEDGAKKAVTCTLGTGYVTLTKVTTTDGKGLFTVSNAPAWNGKKINDSFKTDELKKAIKEALGLDAFPDTDWKDYADANTAVYTPIGLAMNAGKFTLKNDIDLNNKDWTPAATTGAEDGDINGNGKTIKNIKVAVPADKAAEAAATAGLGLFSELKNNVTNLVLDGVTINAVQYTTDNTKYVVSNIGALAGKLTAAKEIKYVTIKNINLSSSNGGGVIGGVIGTNTAAATLTGVVVSGTNAIKGYGNLGGLIGYAAANVTIKKCGKGDVVEDKIPAADVVSAATVSFTANYNNPNATNDVNYLRVGNFIGSAPTSAKITITDAASVKPALTYDKSTYTGTTKYQTTEEGQTKSYDIVFDKQTLIGWCGETPFTEGEEGKVPRINNKAYNLKAYKPNLNAIALDDQNWLYYIDRVAPED